MTFDPPVSHLRLTVQDPDWDGNFIIASAGGTVAIPYDNQPGVRSPFDVYFPNDGIAIVDFIPAPDDHVWLTAVSFAKQFHVECSSVVRREQTTCNVVGTVDAVTGWRFEGKVPGTQENPSGDAVVTSSATSSSWSGQAVLSGKVKAYVQINGSPDSASGQLVVQDRSGPEWRWDEAEDFDYQPDDIVTCLFWSKPSIDPRIAINRPRRGCHTQEVEPRWIVPVDPLQAVLLLAVFDDGPNANLVFVTGASFRMESSSEMNPHLLPGGAVDTLTHNDDKKVCRQQLGIPNNQPVIVNFHTYNTICRVFDLSPMFSAVWTHEGLGTNDPNNLAVANGHEARKRIIARQPAVDPNRMAERQVYTSVPGLGLVLRDSVKGADDIIDAAGDAGHAFVKDNYIVGGSCGTAWLFTSGQNQSQTRYLLRPVTTPSGNCM